MVWFHYTNNTVAHENNIFIYRKQDYLRRGFLATIIKKNRLTQIHEKGAKQVKETLLSGPATGSNKLTLRKIEIGPEGKTASKAFNLPVIYFILDGKVVLSHNNDELDLLEQNNTVTLQKNEHHSLHNTSKTKTLVLMITSQ